MRQVNYEVMADNGYKFTTTSYAEATRTGNRIIKTFLTEPDRTPEEILAWYAWHRKKVKEKFNF